MASIRTKLTVAYATALTATIVVFSVALYDERGKTAAESVGRVALGQAGVAATILYQAAEERRPLFYVNDSLMRPELDTAVAARLVPLPGYVLVLDPRGRWLFNSTEARALSGAVQPADTAGRPYEEQFPFLDAAFRQFERLVNEGRRLTAAQPVREVTVRDEPVQLAAVVTPSLRQYGVERVVVGMPSGWIAEQDQQELLATILTIAPLLILLSVALAYVIAGRTFRPMQELMTSLEAISDGRSLHRRLHVGESDDEIARLTTTLNAMLGRLESYFQALRRFTADASHELKTPLTVLRADVERAMHPGTSSRERLVALEEALHETTRMAELVEQLLTLARADEGRFDLHREPVTLEPLVREVFETALILGEAAGLQVTLSAVEDATVMGDHARLRQLFLNLVTNAIKYTPRGGEVEVALRRAGDVVTFAVRDTGIGIAAADLPYIFDRFWRADRVRSRGGERGGFGLGLAISQWIAQAHGGTLTASSRLTRGSVFTVTLPLVPEGATAEYEIPRLPAAQATG